MALSGSGVKQGAAEACEHPGSSPWPPASPADSPSVVGELCRQHPAGTRGPAAAGTQLTGDVCTVL